MMAIMLSIQPQFVEKILNGEKTIEIRKTKPNCELPVKVCIYCTKNKNTALNNHNGNIFLSPKGWQDFSEINGKVVAEFTLNEVECFTTDYRRDGEQTIRISKDSRVDYIDLIEYQKNSGWLYAWHIDDLKIYDQPKELSEFTKPTYVPYDKPRFYFPMPLTRPPQSWCYCDELEGK